MILPDDDGDGKPGQTKPPDIPPYPAGAVSLAEQINLLHAETSRAARGMADFAIQCGELLITAKAAVKHGEWLPWLAEHCPDISEDTAGNYMKLARKKDKLQNSEHDRNLSIRQALKAISDDPPHVAHNSGCNEWYTPACYIDQAFRVMGDIDLDPASCEVANQLVQATRFFSAADDGLQQEWHGRIWLNPPYAKDLIAKFADKLIDEIDAGRVTQAIVLVNNATETSWFQHMAGSCSAICLHGGRIQFIGPAGDAGSPLQGQAVVYFGDNIDAFTQEYQASGLVLVNPRVAATATAGVAGGGQ